MLLWHVQSLNEFEEGSRVFFSTLSARLYGPITAFTNRPEMVWFWSGRVRTWKIVETCLMAQITSTRSQEHIRTVCRGRSSHYWGLCWTLRKFMYFALICMKNHHFEQNWWKIIDVVSLRAPNCSECRLWCFNHIWQVWSNLKLVLPLFNEL